MEPLVTQGNFRELKAQQSSLNLSTYLVSSMPFGTVSCSFYNLRESNTPLIVSLREEVIFFNNIQGICFKLLENH